MRIGPVGPAVGHRRAAVWFARESRPRRPPAHARQVGRRPPPDRSSSGASRSSAGGSSSLRSPPDSAHVFAALVMSGGAVLFASASSPSSTGPSAGSSRPNHDLAAAHAVASALQGGLTSRPRSRTPSTASSSTPARSPGEIRVAGPGDRPLAVRRPLGLGAGLQWVETILDDAPAPLADVVAPISPASTPRSSTCPLRSTAGLVGAMRLAVPPVRRSRGSPADALADLGEKIGTAAGLATSLADLRREEHERAALYSVALQLTGRAELRDLLDLITKHARELLGPTAPSPASPTRAPTAAATSGRAAWRWPTTGEHCFMAHPAGRGCEAPPGDGAWPQPGLPAPARGSGPTSWPARFAAPTASSASCACPDRRRAPSRIATASCSARSPTSPRSRSGRPASARTSSSSPSSPSATGSPASSTTASPRSWA